MMDKTEATLKDALSLLMYEVTHYDDTGKFIRIAANCDENEWVNDLDVLRVDHGLKMIIPLHSDTEIISLEISTKRIYFEFIFPKPKT